MPNKEGLEFEGLKN